MPRGPLTTYSVALAIALAMMSVRIVNSWHLPDEKALRNENEFYRAREFLSTIPRDSMVLIDHLGVDYYSDAKTTFVYAHRNWPLLHAKNKAEVHALLLRNRVRYVLLEAGMKTWWSYSILGQALADPAVAQEVYGFKKWRGYRVLP
jgi:hypothetical protein